MKTDNGEWKWQLSIKVKDHLVNIRAGDITEFVQALRDFQSNAPEIASAAAAFDWPMEPPREPGYDNDEGFGDSPVPLAGTEIGPAILKAEVKTGIGKNGKAYTRYVATMAGITASTFDSLIGSIILQLNGKRAFLHVEKQGSFHNLISARAA